MNSNFYYLIIQAKQNDTSAFLKIVEKFHPQIQKYSYLLDKDDTYQTLIIFLFELIKKIPDDKECFNNDKILFSYISKSLKHKYIQLSIQKSNISSVEIELTPAFALADRKQFETSILLSDLLKELNHNELKIIFLIYFYGYSVKEISIFLHVSPQAVNQTKNRALKKLRSV